MHGITCKLVFFGGNQLSCNIDLSMSVRHQLVEFCFIHDKNMHNLEFTIDGIFITDIDFFDHTYDGNLIDVVNVYPLDITTRMHLYATNLNPDEFFAIDETSTITRNKTPYIKNKYRDI